MQCIIVQKSRKKLAKLKRITDVLEDMNGALIEMGGDIEALGECVGTIPARYTKERAAQ